MSKALVKSAIWLVILCLSDIAAGQYQEILSTAYVPNEPGGAAIVVQNGEVLFAGASGLANAELGVPLSTDSVFRIASLTKQFTAVAILMLHEDGKLDLDDPITEFLPDYPMQGHLITIEHLLTHTSGIVNITEIPEFYGEGLHLHDATTEENIDVFKNKPLDFAPGEKFKYSNSGYILLGAIIEKITERPFDDFMEEQIFAPLEMDSTDRDGPQIITNRASGYYITDEELFNSTYTSMTRPHAAGALVSTVGDLAKWSTVLSGGNLITENSLRQMMTGYELNDGERAPYGFGLDVSDLFDSPMLSHTGGIPGFVSMLIWLPAEQVFVAVLSNRTDDYPGPEYVAYSMALEAAGIENPFDADYSVPPDELAAYTGTYRLDDDITISVTVKDGVLYTAESRDESDPYELAPFAEDAFYYPGWFSYVEFDRDDQGTVVGIAIHYDPSNASTYAKRE